MRIRTRVSLLVLALLLVAGVAGVVSQAPSIAAGALLYPARRPLTVARPAGCVNATLDGQDVVLRGWSCPSPAGRRGTVVFLHGVADNREGAAGTFERFTTRGFDVVAYDSRAHGESGGEMCTYGYYEKQDLRRVVRALADGPVVLIGGSLGAAVALQAAADEPRVSAVVAAEVFSDLATIARDRAPWFLPEPLIRRALRDAEARGHFDVEAVSPADAARRITVPVLLIHGALDTDTPPAHSQRVFQALRGPKRLWLVEGARHNQSLGLAATWAEITRWLDEVTGTP